MNHDMPPQGYMMVPAPPEPVPLAQRIKSKAWRAGLVFVILSLAYFGIWLFLQSPYGAPIVDAARPAVDGIYGFAVRVFNDPLGIDWGAYVFAIAAFILPHLGILLFLFDDW